MKKWVGKLKESDNYNLLIPAMLVLLTVSLLLSVLVAVNNIRQVILWEMTGMMDLLFLVKVFVSLILIILAMSFVAQACMRDPKFMICALVCMALVAVIGLFPVAIICIVTGLIWFASIKERPGKAMHNIVKTVAAIVLIAAALIFLRGLFVVSTAGFYAGWSSDSIEEGDWSEWETEDVHFDKEEQ